MTVILYHDYDAGYCLMNEQGYMICSIWFDSEENALDYCNKHNLTLTYLDEENDDD